MNNKNEVVILKTVVASKKYFLVTIISILFSIDNKPLVSEPKEAVNLYFRINVVTFSEWLTIKNEVGNKA